MVFIESNFSSYSKKKVKIKYLLSETLLFTAKARLSLALTIRLNSPDKALFLELQSWPKNEIFDR